MTARRPDSGFSGSEFLLGAPAWRAVLRLGLPQAIGLASHALVNLVDLMLVGRLGQQAVAAAHVATTINFLPMIFGNGISVATLSLLARRLGAGDRRGARALSNRSQFLMLLVGLVLGVATALPAPWCVDTVGLAEPARRAAVHYLVVSNLGCLPMFALMQVTTSMRAVGEVRMPLMLLLGANLLNLVLDLLLMFGWSAIGLPAFGVVGAAYASAVSRAVAAGVGYLWLMRPGNPLRLSWRPRPRRQEPSLLWHLLVMATPQLAQIGLRALLVWALTVLAQRLAGDDAVAALGIVSRLDTLILFAAAGFGSAATTLAGRCVAVGDQPRARRIGLWAAVQAMALGALFVGLLYWFREVLVAVFLPGASYGVLEQAGLYLAVAALAHPFSAFALAVVGAVHGAGRMVSPLLVDAAGFLLLALLLWSAVASGGGLAQVYWFVVLGAGILALGHALHLLLGRWPEARLGRF